MRWCLYLIVTLVVIVSCTSCMGTPGGRPWIKSGRQGGNEKIQNQVIGLKLQLKALKADIDAISTATGHIEDANDDITAETERDTPDIPAIAAGSQVIDDEVENLKQRTGSAAGLAKESHRTAEDIQKAAQGEFKFSLFWIIMFKLGLVAGVFMLLNHYVPFFGPIQRFLSNLLGGILRTGSGLSAKVMDMTLEHADASNNVNNDKLPDQVQDEIDKAKGRARKAAK